MRTDDERAPPRSRLHTHHNAAVDTHHHAGHGRRRRRRHASRRRRHHRGSPEEARDQDREDEGLDDPDNDGDYKEN